MPDFVLDSHPVLTYLFDEAGADEVEDFLHGVAEAHELAPITAVNWAEVLYRIKQEEGREGVARAKVFAQTMPIVIVSADLALAEAAAEFKAAHKMSLADAFAAALAQREGAELLTGDPELKAVEGTVRLRWTGPPTPPASSDAQDQAPSETQP